MVMKIAIVHDDLIQWGGAEKVLTAICQVFPDAPIYTSILDLSNPLIKEKFKDKEIICSILQKLPLSKKLYKWFLPLYPLIFEQFDFSGYDLVISHTTRFAKAVITKPGTKHICYCHTPPRFLWNFSGEKVSKLLAPYLSKLRIYDQVSARRVDKWLAGSKNCQGRIKKVYKVDSDVLYPFVDLAEFGEGFDGGYYLLVTRLTSYKRADVAVEAFNNNGLDLKVVGVGPKMGELKDRAKPNIQFLGSVSEEILVQLLLGCKALVVVAEEDFGMAPLEAQAAGKPVIAYSQGGALETVIDGVTGVYFSDQNAVELNNAVKRLERLNIEASRCRENAANFSKEIFCRKLKGLVN